jgi:hypothetical protein
MMTNHISSLRFAAGADDDRETISVKKLFHKKSLGWLIRKWGLKNHSRILRIWSDCESLCESSLVPSQKIKSSSLALASVGPQNFELF